MDAANIDLKWRDGGFYRRDCGGRRAPVLEPLESVRRHTSTWLEVTTLLLPGLNDSPQEISALAEWLAGHLGEDTPLHFSAFHPAFRLTDRPPTPAATLTEARRIALARGLRYGHPRNRGQPPRPAAPRPAAGGRAR